MLSRLPHHHLSNNFRAEHYWVTPAAIITDHHQPYVKVVATVIPLARYVRTGLHRCRGYTTQPVERSHVATRDRLRGTRGPRAVHTGQKFLESFEALHAL